MKTSILSMVAASLLCGVGTGQAAQNDYPTKPVTVVVGYGAGGGADTLARLYAEGLSNALGQPFVVSNRPGAGATTAAGAVAKTPPDGYTLMVAPTAVFTITPQVRTVAYDPIQDFTPVATLATGLGVVIGSKAIPATTLGEFIALAKARPGQYSFGSSGVATSTHLLGEVFKETSGLNLLHVPYKSSSEYLADLMEGRVSLAFDPVLLNLVKADKLNLLGVISDERLKDYPDVGTTREAGMDMSTTQGQIWYGLFAPTGVPQAIVARLADAIKQISQDDEVAQKLAGTGIRPSSVQGTTFQKLIADDIAYYGALIRKFDIKLTN